MGKKDVAMNDEIKEQGQWKRINSEPYQEPRIREIVKTTNLLERRPRRTE